MKKILASFLLLPFAVFAADTNALPALAPAYGEIPPTFLEHHGTPVIIGVCALVVLMILTLWKFLQPKRVVILPPEIVAREALGQLQNRPENGKVLSEISQILRRYLGDAFDLPGHELTTAECCSAIAGNEKIGSELAQTTAAFLRECDVRKFSPANAATPLNAARRALELVEQAEQRLAESSAAQSVSK